MRIIAIIQARMSSQRLPGKVLFQVKGKPMLQYLLERVERCNTLDSMLVATSVDESDLPIVDFCRKYGVACYRGSLDDVAGRFAEAITRHPCDAFVRVNGDSPLIDPGLIDKGLVLARKEDYDLITNIFPRSYPKGQSVEVAKSQTFIKTYSKMIEQAEKEHVTRFYYSHPDLFSIRNFASDNDYSDIQLSVDTAEDMSNFISIIEKMHKPHWDYSLKDILSLSQI